ncbi:hypothetical protein BLNAU_5147 [Blattamonas nauphoetae]|uniref:Uncharacterized protein n=1 Tax=Blattamonas nauphoetae TaxID=2049346 RepID=A0ABQ9Y879_9EUKA|nr:hypothetical protein BLNAU_5147 [Blattamonas nauphoetae]
MSPIRLLLQMYATVPDNRVVLTSLLVFPQLPQHRFSSASRRGQDGSLLTSCCSPQQFPISVALNGTISRDSLCIIVHVLSGSMKVDQSFFGGSMRLQWKNRSGFMYNSLLVEWKIWLPLQLPSRGVEDLASFATPFSWSGRSGFLCNSLRVEWKIWLPLQLPSRGVEDLASFATPFSWSGRSGFLCNSLLVDDYIVSTKRTVS